uniref:Uncharacterized protein n=1 Tax=Glossina palpalis gambiensis TaxID=67801 RepID=A0A1B0B8D1_9MUSC
MTPHIGHWQNCRTTSVQLCQLSENCLISKVSHVRRSSVEEQRYLLLMQDASGTGLEANFCYAIFQANIFLTITFLMNNQLAIDKILLNQLCHNENRIKLLSAKVNGNEAAAVIAVVVDGVVGVVDVIIGVVAVDIVNSLAGLRFTIVVLITVVVSGDEGVVG